MKKLLLIFFLLCSMEQVVGASSEDRSGKGVRFRLFASLGGWSSNFKQSTNGHETKINTLVSEGLSQQIGFSVYRLFFEYQMTWLISPYSAGPQARDATYFSSLGFNAGLLLPFLPVELYVGIEDGTYRLSGGLNPAYKGTSYKGGAAIYFQRKNVFCFGIRAEYRRMQIGSDDAGVIPSAYTTGTEMYFIGLTFGGR